jgi:DinB superfamily
MRPLDPILERLRCAQTAFFRAADSVSPKQWKTKPKAGAWSAAELVAHLLTAERAILGGAERITRKIPKPIPFLKRFHFPMWLVESRIIRRKSPIPLDPSLLDTKEEMLGELRAARERTLAFWGRPQRRI